MSRDNLIRIQVSLEQAIFELLPAKSMAQIMGDKEVEVRLKQIINAIKALNEHCEQM